MKNWWIIAVLFRWCDNQTSASERLINVYSKCARRTTFNADGKGALRNTIQVGNGISSYQLSPLRRLDTPNISINIYGVSGDTHRYDENKTENNGIIRRQLVYPNKRRG